MPAPRDRHSPELRRSPESDLSLVEFMREFPDDAACLSPSVARPLRTGRPPLVLPHVRAERKFHRTKTRASYTCDTCGLHIHPQKGTIFRAVLDPLHLWVVRHIPDG